MEFFLGRNRMLTHCWAEHGTPVPLSCLEEINLRKGLAWACLGETQALDSWGRLESRRGLASLAPSPDLGWEGLRGSFDPRALPSEAQRPEGGGAPVTVSPPLPSRRSQPFSGPSPPLGDPRGQCLLCSWASAPPQLSSPPHPLPCADHRGARQGRGWRRTHRLRAGRGPEPTQPLELGC